MAKLLKNGVKNPAGLVASMASDMGGGVVASASGRYIPHRWDGYAESLGVQRNYIKSRYIKDTFSILTSGADMLSAWTTPGTGSSIVTNRYGYAARFANSSKTSYTPYITFPTQWDVSAFKSLAVRMTCDTPANVGYLNISFECPDENNRYRITAAGNNAVIRNYINALNGAGAMVFDRTDIEKNKNGYPDWSKLKTITIYLQSATEGVEASVEINDISMITPVPTRPKIIMRIDDGLASVYDVAKPIFEKYNAPATLFINPAYVSANETRKKHTAYGGTHDAMTLAELKELHDMGWCICSHTYNHNLYADPSASATSAYPRKHYSQAYHDLSATQDWLINNGFGDGATSHVYGNHYYNADAMDASLDIMLVDYSLKPTYSQYNPLPWGKSVTHITQTDLIAKSGDNFTAIDELVNRGGLAVTCLHMFEGDDVNGSISGTTLDSLLAYICSKDIDVITAYDLAYATPVALR